jgi:hypothetical protein
MPVDGSVIELIVSWQRVTVVRYAIFLFRDFFLDYLLSMFTEIEETDHSSEFGLDLALIVTAHELLEFVDFFFDYQRRAVDRFNRAK